MQNRRNNYQALPMWKAHYRGTAVSVAVDLTKCSPTGNTASKTGTSGDVKINACRTMANGDTRRT
ncbi:hypothetical protein EVC45_40740 [Paraburkholderia sp. UYCP14C]|uniref:VirK family protein n=1 Tax=Paraburkholderia sp. UYCP14C TaxID=2511130 RepID=UPI001022294F|nr:hypothetical protein EVC45_40740 [Paraburkholderia sp. UYCP14C]